MEDENVLMSHQLNLPVFVEWTGPIVTKMLPVSHWPHGHAGVGLFRAGE